MRFRNLLVKRKNNNLEDGQTENLEVDLEKQED